MIFVAAGTITTAQVLATITYSVLARPRVLARLRAELEAAVPDPSAAPSLAEVERLPYLSAIIFEGTRLASGVAHRLHRVVPDVALRYGDWAIPAGVPVAMLPVLMHDNAAVFPEPDQLEPERWLPLAIEGHRLPRAAAGASGRASRMQRCILPWSVSSASLAATWSSTTRRGRGTLL